MNPVTSKKTIYRKDTKTYSFVLKRGGAPISLTGLTPYLTAKDAIDGALLFDKAGTVTVAAEGKCQVTLASTDTDTTCENGIAEVVLVTTATGAQDTLGQFYIDILPDAKTTGL